MYPMEETFGEMLLAANLKLRLQRGFSEADKPELTKVFDILLAMIFDTRRGSIATHWNESEDHDSFFGCPVTGKDLISLSLSLAIFVLDDFNHRRANCITPGRMFCVDESKSFRSGLISAEFH